MRRILPWVSLLLCSLCMQVTQAQPADSQVDDKKPPTHTERGLQIEEVLVTVSKRTESLQDVLGSVSALSGEMLAENNVQDFRSLAELLPGMVVQGEEAGREQVAIRGISRTRDGPSPVAFHINDMFTEMRGEPYYDLQAVEVVRGPSGTAYGRNATAGAINAKWRQPEAEWGVGGGFRYSSLTSKELRAYVNMPLLGEGDDRLLARIAGFSRDHDGTIDNLLRSDDADPGNFSDQFVRIYLTSNLGDALQLGLRAIKYRLDTQGEHVVFSPDAKARRSGQLEGLGAQPLSQDTTEVRSVASDRYGHFEDEYTRIAGDVTWALTNLPVIGDMDIVVVGGEVRREFKSVYDLDGTEAVIVDGQTVHPSDVRRSAELRFVSNSDSGFDWLLGFFDYRKVDESYMDVSASQYFTPSLVGLPPELDLVPIPITAQVETRGVRIIDDSQATFLNVNFDLAQLFDLPHIEVSAGLRRNRDKFSNETASSVQSINVPGIGLTPVISDTNINQYATFTETTGDLGLRWFYNDTGMAYVKLARGYKPGLAQRLETLDEGIIQNPVQPEFLDSIELGWKSSFLEQSLQTNMALFFYDYKDLQVSQITVGGVITENAAQATIQGFEMDFRWLPTAGLSIQGGFAWTDATYGDYCGSDPAREKSDPEPGCDEDNPFDFSGETLPAAPQFSASLVASYRFELGEWGRVTPSIQTSWTDEINRRGLGNDDDVLESHSNSAVRLSWESFEGGVKVTAFVENIEDNNDLFFNAAPIPLGADRPNLLVLAGNLPPRVAGVSMELNF